MAETNVDLAGRGFEAVLRGDLDLVGELLDPDVKWHGDDPSAPGACGNRRQALAFIQRARDGGETSTSSTSWEPATRSS